MPLSTEDTMIEARPKRSGSLLATFANESDASPSGGMLERCRQMFRQLGERMSSFDLSRQIYG